MLKKIAKFTLVSFLFIITASLCAYDIDYAGGVAITSDTTPTEAVSHVNDYINQDEQINLNPDSGTVKVLRTDQKALTNDFVTAIIELKNADPRELRNLARVICRKEGGEAEVLMDQESKKNYIYVCCPKFQLPYITETLQTVDKDWVKEYNDGCWTMYYKAKNRNIRDIIDVLSFHRSPDRIVLFDDSNNAVGYSEQPNIAPLVMWGLETADIPPSQMTLDVAIYEVDTQNDLKLGLDWTAWKNGPGRDLFEFVFWDFNGDDPLGLFPGAIVNSGVDYGRVRHYNVLATTAYVDFLQSKGKARLVTKSTVSAKSGTVANVQAIDEVVNIQSQAASTPTVVNIPYVDKDGVSQVMTITEFHERMVNYRSSGQIGINLDIFPVVGLETSELAIALDVSSVNGYTPSGGPIIDRRYITSYVDVKDGQPLVLGGIKKSSEVSAVNGLPFLRDIPYLGYLFGNETTTKRETELVVFLTPRFQTCPMSTAEAPQEFKTATALATGEEDLEVPSNPFGFDQWLLDSEK